MSRTHLKAEGFLFPDTPQKGQINFEQSPTRIKTRKRPSERRTCDCPIDKLVKGDSPSVGGEFNGKFPYFCGLHFTMRWK